MAQVNFYNIYKYTKISGKGKIYDNVTKILSTVDKLYHQGILNLDGLELKEH